MIITEKSKERVSNKVMLFSELTRIDEALAKKIIMMMKRPQ